MTTSNSTKTCSICKATKPLSDFYTRPNTRDGHFAFCKDCAKERAKTYPANDYRKRYLAHRPGEILAIEYLRSLGIYATPGKSSEWTWVDVVAWGCVKIEVKHSHIQQNDAFSFKLGEKISKSDLVVLVCDREPEISFHVFRSSDPVFMMNGRCKTKMIYRPNTDHKPEKYATIGNPMTDALMMEAQDRWDLIDLIRQEKQVSLKNEHGLK